MAQRKNPYDITDSQLAGLKLLCLPDEVVLTEPQKQILQHFVVEAAGDLALNAKLKKIAGMSLRNTGLNSGIIGNLIAFTYKTRRIKDLPPIMNKMIKNENRIQNNMRLADPQRISLKEYSIFLDAVKTKPFLDSFKRKLQYSDNSTLGRIHILLEKANKINNVMESSFNESLKFKAGTLVFDDTQKKSHVLGRSLSFLENMIKRFITSHGHASKLYQNSRREPTLSHINPLPKDDKFVLRDYLYTNVYQIKLDKLITPQNKKQLQKMYGDQWLAVLNDKYARIEKRIHDNTVQKFGRLIAQTDKKQKKVGALSLLPFGLGHKKFNKTNFSQIHQRILDKHYANNQGTMLCSEFVAMTTIGAMVELNNQLLADASFKQVKLNGLVIKPPISQHEDLSNLHPDRLLKILQSKDCIEKLPLADKVQNYFKITR